MSTMAVRNISMYFRMYNVLLLIYIYKKKKLFVNGLVAEGYTKIDNAYIIHAYNHRKFKKKSLSHQMLCQHY